MNLMKWIRLSLSWISGLIGLCGTAFAAPTTLSFDDARHLLVRTGFGASPSEIERLVGQSADAAIDDILNGVTGRPHRDLPPWVNDWKYPSNVIYHLGDTATDLFFSQRSQDIDELSAWWRGCAMS